MVVVPDPQAYTRYGRNQGILEIMTAWIAENKEKLNIQQVICVGDIVESNNLQFPDGKFANQTSKQMWECSSRAFSRLDGVYPYVLVTGNHDYGPYIYPDGNHYGTRSSLNRETQFNAYFPSDRNPAWKSSPKQVSAAGCAPYAPGHPCRPARTYRYPVYKADGSEKNVKLTTPEDIEIFKALLSSKKDEWMK